MDCLSRIKSQQKPLLRMPLRYLACGPGEIHGPRESGFHEPCHPLVDLAHDEPDSLKLALGLFKFHFEPN